MDWITIPVHYLKQMVLTKSSSYGAFTKQYLSLAKSKKHSAKQIRKTLKKLLSYVRRNIGYLEGFMSAGLPPRQKDIPTIFNIFKFYEQQKNMYDNKVENWIESISQP